jgi:hypothetical protein
LTNRNPTCRDMRPEIRIRSFDIKFFDGFFSSWS